MAVRPRIAIPGRNTLGRGYYRCGDALVSRDLVDYVWAAGGDPLLLPIYPDDLHDDWASRLRGFDAVLLPGGGDVQPSVYGGDDSEPTLDRVDPRVDAADMSLAHYAIAEGIPLLAICRGLQVLNVALGGTLIADMANAHRYVTTEIQLGPAAKLLGYEVGQTSVACNHHQCVDQVAPALEVIARAADGTVEAVRHRTAAAWTAGIQWHPEYSFHEDATQLAPIKSVLAAI